MILRNRFEEKSKILELLVPVDLIALKQLGFLTAEDLLMREFGIDIF